MSKSLFKYKNISLPSIAAYQYHKKTIDTFHQRSIPMACDTHMICKCNASCIYCSTKGGTTEDYRFTTTLKLKITTDVDVSQVIQQCNDLGVSSFFLCSPGEPLLNSQRFLKIVNSIKNRKINIVTYTNGSTLTKPFLKELFNRKISLIIKVESLNPIINNEIIRYKYQYKKFKGRYIQKGLINALEIYKDNKYLAISSQILNQNIDELLHIRKFAFKSLNISHFLKHVYPLGATEKDTYNCIPSEYKKRIFDNKIKKFDKEYNIHHPKDENYPEKYSYDVRRFQNNTRNQSGIPFRIFIHQTGGLYISGEYSPVNFHWEGEKVSIFNNQNHVDMYSFFKQIYAKLKGIHNETKTRS